MNKSILCCVVLLSYQSSLAFSAETDRRGPHLIVLATVGDLDSARQEVERASALLGYGIDGFNLPVSGEPRNAGGDLISAHRTGSGLFEIVCCLTDSDRIDESLTTARRFYPTARIRPEPRAVQMGFRPYVRSGVLVAGSYRSYEAAVRAAETLEVASGIPFGTRGLVYDETWGLIQPDSSWENPADSFYRRRYDADCFAGRGPDPSPCLTIEPSDAYGFEPGHYIVVAGVLGRGPERDDRLRALREFVPDAYVKETNLWMGCIN